MHIVLHIQDRVEVTSIDGVHVANGKGPNYSCLMDLLPKTRTEYTTHTHQCIASHNYCRAHTQIREESEELLEEGSALDVEALENVALHSAQDATDALIDPVDLVQGPLYDPIDLIQIEVFTSSAGTPDPKAQPKFGDKPSL